MPSLRVKMLSDQEADVARILRSHDNGVCVNSFRVVLLWPRWYDRHLQQCHVSQYPLLLM